MQAIKKLAEILNQYPFVKHECRENAICALPGLEKGFEVTLLVNRGFCTVCYALWHTEFADEETQSASTRRSQEVGIPSLDACRHVALKQGHK